jgi:hypothetical protein
MNRIAQLRKFFTISLITVALFLGTAFSHVTQSALAADSRKTNDVSNVKGDSSAVNRSYHNLQAATQDYRRTFRTGEEGGTPPGKNTPQSKRNDRIILPQLIYCRWEFVLNESSVLAWR